MRFVLLLCSLASAAVPSGLKTATSDQQAEIVAAAKEAAEAYDKSREYFQLAELAKLHSADQWERLWKQAQIKEAVFVESSERALRKTAEYYGIAPAGMPWGGSQPAQQGPRLHSPITWQPTVLATDERYFSYTDAQGNARYAGGQVDPKKDGGRTWPDGSVTIFLTMLRETAKDGFAGRMAYIVFHEGVHLEEQMTRAEDWKQAGEVRAYKLCKEAAAVFQLPAHVVAQFDQAIKENLEELQKGLGRSKYLTPEEEADVKKEYEARQQELARFKKEEEELKRKANEDHHVAKLGELCEAACRNEKLISGTFYGVDTIDPARYALEARNRRTLMSSAPTCVERICLKVLDRLAGGSGLSEDWFNDLGREVQLSMVLEGLERDAAACGFTLIKDGGYLDGFEADLGDGSKVAYKLIGPHPAAVVRGKFLMARSCLTAVLNPKASRKWGYDPLCVNAFADMQDAFETDLSMSVDNSDQAHCLKHTLPFYTSREKTFLKAVRKTAKKWEFWHKERERVRRHNERVLQEQQNQQQSNDGGGGGDNDDDDEDPGGCSEPNPDTGIVGCPG